MTLLHFVGKNALRNHRRSAMTVLSIGFSLLLLTFLVSLWHAFYQDAGPPDDALRLLTRHRVSLSFLLPAYYRERIRKVPGVVAVVPWNWIGNHYKDDKPEHFFAQYATDPDEVFQVVSDWTIPPDQLRAWQQDVSGAAVERRLAAAQGWKLGDHLFLQKNLYPVDLELTVRAIYAAPPEASALLFNWKTLEAGNTFLRDKTDTFLLRVDAPASVPAVEAGIDTQFRNAPAPTRTETQKAFQLDFLNSLGNIKAFIIAIAAAVGFAILLVSGNTMAMTVRERTREVAVLRTIGFPRRMILGLFLGEAVTLALVGGMLGILGARWLIAGVAASPQLTLFAGFFRRARVTLPTVLFGLLVAACVGLLSGLVPAYRAARMNIVAGLRHIG